MTFPSSLNGNGFWIGSWDNDISKPRADYVASSRAGNRYSPVSSHSRAAHSIQEAISSLARSQDRGREERIATRTADYYEEQIQVKTHISLLSYRMLRAGLRNHTTRYRVVAAGLDYRNRIISISTNSPRLESRGWHAEERIIHSSPRSLVRILIARYNRRGDMLPIDPCEKCKKLAEKYGVQIERLELV